jgi:hypothetical protein
MELNRTFYYRRSHERSTIFVDSGVVQFSSLELIGTHSAYESRKRLIGALMRAGFFIAVIPILASAQTREQITAIHAQIAARQAQKNVDLAITQRDALEARLDVISQRDALQNQPKTGEAGANPSQQDVLSAADRSQPQQEPQSATSLPAPVPAIPQAENEQATDSQNHAHRSLSESARSQRIRRARETKTRNSAASTRATPILSQLRNEWDRFWQRPKANP